MDSKSVDLSTQKPYTDIPNLPKRALETNLSQLVLFKKTYLTFTAAGSTDRDLVRFKSVFPDRF